MHTKEGSSSLFSDKDAWGGNTKGLTSLSNDVIHWMLLCRKIGFLLEVLCGLSLASGTQGREIVNTEKAMAFFLPFLICSFNLLSFNWMLSTQEVDLILIVTWQFWYMSLCGFEMCYKSLRKSHLLFCNFPFGLCKSPEGKRFETASYIVFLHNKVLLLKVKPWLMAFLETRPTEWLFAFEFYFKIHLFPHDWNALFAISSDIKVTFQEEEKNGLQWNIC